MKHRPLPLALPTLLALGCSDQDSIYLPPEPPAPSSTLNPNQPAPAEGDERPMTDEPTADAPGPLYAVMYEVFDDIGSNSYLSLLDSLDADTVDPARSREYAGGRAYLRTFNGWVFIGDPTSPLVTRYSVDADGELVDERTVSFGNFGLDSGSIDAWNLTFISPTKAYLFDSAQAATIVWDPTSMEILRVIEAPPELVREGMSLTTSAGALRGDRLYRSLFWVNYDDATYSSDQLLAVFDVESDRLLEIVPETRCPAPGNLAHQDEAGNIYFSNWIWPIAGTLMRDAPKSCVLRIPEGSDRFDPSWTLSYAELSGGREGAMFTYLAEGRGLVSIFDHTQLEFDATTDPWDYAGSGVWSIWNVDLETREASRLPGIPDNAGAYTPAVIDGRTFLIVPEEGWGSASVYEVRDGVARPGIDIPGWSYAIEKVR